MIPQGAQISAEDQEETAVLPSLTYVIQASGQRIGRLQMDGKDAVKQAVYKVMSTRRYEHLIYSADYGMEWSWEGMAGRSMVESELERWIREALLPDDRISDVTEFDFVHEADGVRVSFTVETDFGSFRQETEVNMDV
ncbi:MULTISPECIES: DUF2634 domain-containing protein [unclassified Paenibacillus]|uniref:DUF2634 domain-containing protein n=1 Tax=unclassified Paenibacillus TaxID=185978 RepID=UPI000CFD4D9C|nr:MULTISPECIES: DUF2634 domain-containing protein [unclassified Paenibacillus]PRA02559.1 hypothetical protein CQ043_20920 [Paenibacillus sp. MYb63]PRA45365.1 hypothetical protein CQ061_20880 [Paenibacillus sp. MYb67]QZN78263.1 DUF2634 domain-containing protein [Paenibacillus sp. DR312]